MRKGRGAKYTTMLVKKSWATAHGQGRWELTFPATRAGKAPSTRFFGGKMGRVVTVRVVDIFRIRIEECFSREHRVRRTIGGSRRYCF